MITHYRYFLQKPVGLLFVISLSIDSYKSVDCAIFFTFWQLYSLHSCTFDMAMVINWWEANYVLLFFGNKLIASNHQIYKFKLK